MRSKITKNSKVVIVTHELFYGAAQALRDYLAAFPVHQLVFISHPINKENVFSYVQVFKQGKLLKQQKRYDWKSLFIFEYIRHEILSLYWIYKEKIQYDIFIGINPLNCILGIFLKKIGVVNQVVFYAIDFTPRRFNNSFLNAVYHSLESFCVRHADDNWNVSPRIEEGRKKFLGLSKPNQKVVPIGVWEKDIVRVHKKIFQKPIIIFVGHVLEKQGVQMVVKALPRIVKKIKNITLLIVGDGDYRGTLEKQVKQMHMKEHVIFHGMEHNQDIIKSLLAKSSLAIACYSPSGESESNFTYYADPTKIKTYLASGLPVILTETPYNAREIAKKKCGIVVAYDERSIANGIAEILIDRVKFNAFKKNAVRYIKNYTWENIFNSAFNVL